MVHIQLWHYFDTVKLHILVLLLFLWGPQTVWFVILHLENIAHEFFGGYVWHGEINITYFHHLHIWFYCEQFISIFSQTPYYNCINNSYVLRGSLFWGVAWHRRHSSWHLWGSHILLYILHISPLSHYGCNNMCDQLWSIHTYLIIWLFSLFSIIFHYFSLFFIIIIIIIVISLFKVVHIQLWHCFDTVKSYTCVVVFLWGPQTVWFVILHLGNTAHKFFGGYCDTVKLISPILTIYTFGFIVNNSSLYLPKLLIIFV